MTSVQQERLKRRLNLTGNDQDALLHDLLSDAESIIKAYTGRRDLPPLLDGALVELAAGSYNRLGLEGEATHSEGGISASFEGLSSLQKAMLDMYRLGRVGGL